MPTYDYICDACGHEFEVFESIMSKPRTDCPECKLSKLRRKIGPGAAILFKGSGFLPDRLSQRFVQEGGPGR